MTVLLLCLQIVASLLARGTNYNYLVADIFKLISKAEFPARALHTFSRILETLPDSYQEIWTEQTIASKEYLQLITPYVPRFPNLFVFGWTNLNADARSWYLDNLKELGDKIPITALLLSTDDAPLTNQQLISMLELYCTKFAPMNDSRLSSAATYLLNSDPEITDAIFQKGFWKSLTSLDYGFRIESLKVLFQDKLADSPDLKIAKLRLLFAAIRSGTYETIRFLLQDDKDLGPLPIILDEDALKWLLEKIWKILQTMPEESTKPWLFFECYFAFARRIYKASMTDYAIEILTDYHPSKIQRHLARLVLAEMGDEVAIPPQWMEDTTLLPETRLPLSARISRWKSSVVKPMWEAAPTLEEFTREPRRLPSLFNLEILMDGEEPTKYHPRIAQEILTADNIIEIAEDGFLKVDCTRKDLGKVAAFLTGKVMEFLTKDEPLPKIKFIEYQARVCKESNDGSSSEETEWSDFILQVYKNFTIPAECYREN